MPCVKKMMKGEKSMKAEHMKQNRLWAMAVVAVLLFVALAVMPVAASVWPDYHDTIVPIANQPPRFTYQNATGYYFNLTNATGGMNAIHITDSTSSPAGACYLKNTAADLNGTFYVSTTGGRNGQDDIILMVGISSTNQTDIDNFNIDIKEHGYNWSPTSSGTVPELVTYYSPSIDVTLDSTNLLKDGDDVVVSQPWKFAPTADYPIYCGQDLSNEEEFVLWLVDNRVGTINGTWYNQTYPSQPLLNDKGMTKIDYAILSHPSSSALIAFNVYAYNNQTTQGQGINWLNKVNISGAPSSGSSGWLVQPV